jgi:uncharacterized membrane protein
VEVQMSVESMLWAAIGFIAVVGGGGLVVCLFALAKASKY